MRAGLRALRVPKPFFWLCLVLPLSGLGQVLTCSTGDHGICDGFGTSEFGDHGICDGFGTSEFGDHGFRDGVLEPANSGTMVFTMVLEPANSGTMVFAMVLKPANSGTMVFAMVLERPDVRYVDFPATEAPGVPAYYTSVLQKSTFQPRKSPATTSVLQKSEKNAKTLRF